MLHLLRKTTGSSIVYQLRCKYSFSFLSFHKVVNLLYVHLPGISIFSFLSPLAAFTGLRMKTYQYIKVACVYLKLLGGIWLVLFPQGFEGFNFRCSSDNVFTHLSYFKATATIIIDYCCFWILINQHSCLTFLSLYFLLAISIFNNVFQYNFYVKGNERCYFFEKDSSRRSKSIQIDFFQKWSWTSWKISTCTLVHIQKCWDHSLLSSCPKWKSWSPLHFLLVQDIAQGIFSDSSKVN